MLEAAFARVRSRALADAAATEALERALLGEWRDAEESLARERLAFVLRWQQLTGPAAAKGVEDTALYVYAPVHGLCSTRVLQYLVLRLADWPKNSGLLVDGSLRRGRASRGSDGQRWLPRIGVGTS